MLKRCPKCEFTAECPSKRCYCFCGGIMAPDELEPDNPLYGLSAAPAPFPPHGPGTEFAALVASLGLTIPCGSCKLLLADMNRWGADECEQRQPEILKRMRENERHLKWGARVKAMSKAARKGYGSRKALLDEAIKRARLKA